MGSRRFTVEFKREAVALVRERGVSVAQAARDLGLHVNLLHRWIKAARNHGSEAFPGHGRLRPDDAEMARLKRELARAKAERDILKKAIGYFAKEPT
jgi:transposase